jgi:hypothetical protein
VFEAGGKSNWLYGKFLDKYIRLSRKSFAFLILPDDLYMFLGSFESPFSREFNDIYYIY